MAAKTRKKPRIGDTCWFVEWCSEAVPDLNGDLDYDATTDKEHSWRFATKEEAAKFAREVYPQTVGIFEHVTYYPAEFVAYDERDAETHPTVGFWEATGDGEVYDGEA